MVCRPLVMAKEILMSVDGESEAIRAESQEVVYFALQYISASWFAYHIQLRAQTPVHETSFLERHPPLAGFTRSIGVQFLHESSGEFLANLYQILTKVI